MSWDPELHPRNPADGEFVRGGGWLRKLGDVMAGRPAQRDLSRDRETLDRAAKALPVTGRWRREDGDGALGEIYRAQGFDAKPEVISHSELDQRVASGWVELWRGFGVRPEYTEQFRTGDTHYPGFGTHANGTYAARGAVEVSDYAVPPPTPEGVDPASARLNWEPQTWPTVARMALHPDARVAVLYGDEWHAWRADVKRSSAEVAQQVDAGGLTKDQARQLQDRHSVLQDFGRWAALKGYDAIVIPGGYDADSGAKNFTGWSPGVNDHYAILNRGAVAVADGPVRA